MQINPLHHFIIKNQKKVRFAPFYNKKSEKGAFRTILL
jgi:hypothetical protein